MEQKRLSFGSVFDKLPPLSSNFPWFVAQNLKAKKDEDYIDNQIFYTLHHPEFHYRCQIPELLGRQIRACFHGWMILSNHPMWFVWNPITSKLICLPPLSSTLEDEDYGCCLSSPPDDPSSIFLLTADEKPTITFCRLDRKRKKLEWAEMSYAKQLRSITNEEGDCFLHNLTCCNGKVYALHTEGNECDDFVIEVQIVVKEREVVIHLLPFLKLPACWSVTRPSIMKGSFSVINLIKGYGTNLFYFNIIHEDDTLEIVDMHLYKLDMTELMWEEMEDLKGAVFFIQLASDVSVFYSPEIATESGGYVHILDETGKLFYSYNAKDRTVSQSSMASLVRSNDVSFSAMLECRLEGDHPDSKQEKKDKNQEIDLQVVTDYEVQFNSKSDESHLLSIPFHMLEKIMEFCVGVEYMKFRATCKSCHLASPPIQWGNKTSLQRWQTHSLLSPWLMLLNRDTITFTDPMFGDEYYIRIPIELIGYSRIYCSKYGWLLMHKESGVSMVLFNPFTSNIIELPPTGCLQSCCFSAPPTSPGCMVLGFTSDGQCHIHFVGGEPLWHSLGISIVVDDPYSFLFPTLHDALCNEKGLDLFRKIGEYYSWEHDIAKPPPSTCGSSTQYLLAKCEQHLLLVIMGKFGKSVEVFKLIDSGKEWEKIDSLGKHAMYICDTTCLCVEAAPKMKNKIYFPILHPDNGKIVFYSLETCRYHTSCDQDIAESLGDLFRTRQHWNPHAWTEPNWS